MRRRGSYFRSDDEDEDEEEEEEDDEPLPTERRQTLAQEFIEFL